MAPITTLTSIVVRAVCVYVLLFLLTMLVVAASGSADIRLGIVEYITIAVALGIAVAPLVVIPLWRNRAR